MKHTQEMQERLIKQFSFWRFQGEMIGLGFKDRGYKKQARDLSKILKVLDKLWHVELGPDYMNEVLKLAKQFDEMNGFEVDETASLKIVRNGGAND